MSDLLTEALPTVWHGQAIDPDFRHMVWLCNTYRRGAGDDPLALACRAIRRFYREPGPLLETAQACSEWYQHLIEFYQAGETATAVRQLHCRSTITVMLRTSSPGFSGCTAST